MPFTILELKVKLISQVKLRSLHKRGYINMEGLLHSLKSVMCWVCTDAKCIKVDAFLQCSVMIKLLVLISLQQVFSNSV